MKTLLFQKDSPGLVGLREGLKGAGRVSGGEPVLLEVQVRVVRGMAELRRTRNARMSARSPYLGRIGKSGTVGFNKKDGLMKICWSYNTIQNHN